MEGSMSEDKQQAVTETVSESPAEETQQSSPNDEYIAESKKYRKRAQDAEASLAKYEKDRTKAEEDRESLSKLDLETLEYVTNKINNIKPNAPEKIGQAKRKGLEKPYSQMTEKEKKENWANILQQYKPS